MNFYNEIDPNAAAWIRELIADGLIPAGDVDTRSICDVQPGDLRGYTQCHFFAGIGGWSLALRLAGWPDDKPVWTGSCPCQPFSCAGQGKGTSDERHLWPEFTRLIEACKPPILFSEQVASKAGREWLAGVFADLARLGYRRAGADLCAPGVQAPHLRQRIYFGAVALGHGFGTRLEGHAGNGDHRDEPGRNGAGTAGPVVAAGCDGRVEHPCRMLGELTPGPGPGAIGTPGARETSQPDGSSASGGLADSECPERREILPRDEHDRNNAGRDQAAIGPGACGEGIRLGHSTSDGSEVREQLHGEHDRTGSDEGRSALGLADSASGGLGADGSAPGTTGHPEQRGKSGGVDNTTGARHAREGQGAELRIERGGECGSQPGCDASSLRVNWRDSVWIHCRDGKLRRVPSQPVFFGVSPRLPISLDAMRAEGGFPLCKKEEVPGRTMLLRGYGNSIIPELAAEFITAFLDAASEL